MLRKRSRSHQKDQYKDHLMRDSASKSCFQPNDFEQKHKSCTFFRVPGLFVGFNIKSVSDSESTKSPTSPLDYSIFKTLGNPFRSPKSCSDGPRKTWDCSKVGLGIVDSLNDESNKSGKIFGLSDSKNILFGSQLRNNIPSSRSYPNASINTSPLNLGSSDIAFRAEENQLEPNPFGKIQSCWSHSSNSLPPLTGLAYCNPSSISEDFWSDKETKSDSPLIDGDLNIDYFLDIRSSSLPNSNHGLMGPLSPSEIELSEYYTCVTCHGPNPRTIHIFGDCVLECYENELADCRKKEEQRIRSSQSVNCSDVSVPYPSDDFLSNCYFCKKKLEGKDIYMYRGEKAFCSSSCRAEEILIEEEMEKPKNNSSNNSPKSTSCENFFLPGMVVFT